MTHRIFISIVLSVLVTATAFAGAVAKTSHESGINIKAADQVRRGLAEAFSGARIELMGELSLSRGVMPSEIKSASFLSEEKQGEARLLLKGRTQDGSEASAEVTARFSAWMPAWIAQRRIHPGEKLSKVDFSLREINVLEGAHRQYRGIILPKETEIDQLEARQTILEGQYVLTTGVQRVPDIRRGDVVRVQLVSGSVRLSTTAVADEPSYMNQQVRVTATKSKKALTGRLVSDGVVEVSL